MKEDQKKLPVWPATKAIRMKDCIWFAAREFNGLYKYVLETGETFLEGQFPEDAPPARELYGNVICFENKLYFPPLRSDYFAVYDIEQKEFSQYKFYDGESYYKFQFAAIYNRCIYYVGYYAGIGVVKFDIDKQKFTKCKEIYDAYFFEEIGECAVSGSHILAPLKLKNIILDFDMQTEACRLHAADLSEFMAGIYIKENLLIILAYNKFFFKKSAGEKFVQSGSIPCKQIDTLQIVDDGLYLFDLFNPYIFFYSFINGDVTKIDCMAEYKGENSDLYKILLIDYDGSQLICFSFYSNEIIIVEGVEIKARRSVFSSDIPQFDNKDVYCRYLRIENEFYDCGLEDYLDYICLEEERPAAAPKESAGEKIFAETVQG